MLQESAKLVAKLPPHSSSWALGISRPMSEFDDSTGNWSVGLTIPVLERSRRGDDLEGGARGLGRRVREPRQRQHRARLRVEHGHAAVGAAERRDRAVLQIGVDVRAHGLPPLGLALSQHPLARATRTARAAAGIGPGAGREQLSARLSREAVVEAELEAGYPRERPWWEPEHLEPLGLGAAGRADLADYGERRRADGARRRGALGERAAVGGEDRRSRRRPRATHQALIRVEAGKHEVGRPRHLAVGERDVELVVELSEDVRAHAHRYHRLVVLLLDVAGAERRQGRLRGRIVVEPAEVRQRVLVLGVRRQLGVHRRCIPALPGVDEALSPGRVRLHRNDHPAGKRQRRDDDQRSGPGDDAASALGRRATSAQSASIRTSALAFVCPPRRVCEPLIMREKVVAFPPEK